MYIPTATRQVIRAVIFLHISFTTHPYTSNPPPPPQLKSHYGLSRYPPTSNSCPIRYRGAGAKESQIRWVELQHDPHIHLYSSCIYNPAHLLQYIPPLPPPFPSLLRSKKHPTRDPLPLSAPPSRPNFPIPHAYSRGSLEPYLGFFQTSHGLG